MCCMASNMTLSQTVERTLCLKTNFFENTMESTKNIDAICHMLMKHLNMRLIAASLIAASLIAASLIAASLIIAEAKILV